MKLYIKNMVCNRCIMVVKQELVKLKLQPAIVSLGEVELQKPASGKQLLQLNERLQEVGFELLDDQKKQQIEKIKNLLIDKVQSGSLEEHFSISSVLSKA
ncbi:MAG: AraC family transcriptional regulator, partial [Ferruginibacter sp.]